MRGHWGQVAISSPAHSQRHPCGPQLLPLAKRLPLLIMGYDGPLRPIALLHPPRERGVLVPAVDIGFGDPDPLGGEFVV